MDIHTDKHTPQGDQTSMGSRLPSMGWRLRKGVLQPCTFQWAGLLVQAPMASPFLLMPPLAPSRLLLLVPAELPLPMLDQEVLWVLSGWEGEGEENRERRWEKILLTANQKQGKLLAHPIRNVLPAHGHGRHF